MYNSPHQFEPLLPQVKTAALYAQAARIVRSALSLNATAHPTARAAIRELVRSINSYYSNQIEGQGTHPANIERALNQDFSQRPDIAKLQRIALAHIDAEKALERRMDEGESALGSAFLIAAHQALYSRLSVADRTIEDGHVVVPGMLRQATVRVGAHIPPAAESVPRFLERMDETYDRPMAWDKLLIAIAYLHHRAVWVHPFLDGNGRATRLQTHCAL